MRKWLYLCRQLLPLTVITMLLTFSGCATETGTATKPAASTSPATNATATNPSAITINLSAQDTSFNTRTITVPAGAAVTVIFENKDRLPHNLSVYTNKSATTVVFMGDIIVGPKTITYRFTAPANPGTYYFRCDPHASMMFGDFIVTGPGS
jgi:plastocyanin